LFITRRERRAKLFCKGAVVAVEEKGVEWIRIKKREKTAPFARKKGKFSVRGGKSTIFFREK